MPILFIVLIFVIWLSYEIKKSSKGSKDSSKQFWERESEALLTPRKSLDDINFITIPENILPPVDFEIPADCEDTTPYERVKTLGTELATLSKAQIADLSEYSNTELRLKYGSPNFTRLSNADTNYTRLVQIMPVLISSLRKTGANEEADKLIDFCKNNSITSNAIRSL